MPDAPKPVRLTIDDLPANAADVAAHVIKRGPPETDHVTEGARALFAGMLRVAAGPKPRSRTRRLTPGSKNG